MNIIISNNVNKPIYEQIYSQIKNHIVTEKLKEGDSLPSIRNLARDLRVSVITTKRAYDELEKDGYISTVASRGCFVAPKDTLMLRESTLREIEEHMEKIIELSKMCDLSDEETINIFKTIQKEIKR